MTYTNPEINFDGIVGPTHNFGGLAHGNVASMKHENETSNPKEAALQGLLKMKAVADKGITQAVLPPQERPAIWMLKVLGFSGENDTEILEEAHYRDPVLLTACCSASAMWTANAVTVTPSVDSLDGRVHFTPANLVSKFHRSLEASTTKNVFEAIFKNKDLFKIHDPLPMTQHFGDEGAANHTRLCDTHLKPGIEIFAYGRQAFRTNTPTPKHFPARQTLEACQAISRRHKLRYQNTLYVQQNPIAIDAGVFHNDVISVGNENVFLYHEQAFLDTDKVIDQIVNTFSQANEKPFFPIKVSAHEVTMQEAVYTYLFNSQLVTTDKDSMLLIASKECEENRVVKKLIEKIINQKTNPINDVLYVNVRESMHNGGGPACLRLRVLLNEKEKAEINQNVILTNQLFETLCDWVKKNYREELHPDDLHDPNLLNESRTALDELTQILKLGSVYRFQTS